MLEFNAMLQAVVQFGFAGLAVVLLCILIWSMKRQFEQAERLTGVIKDNTQGFVILHEATVTQLAQINEVLKETRDIRDKLLSRQCIAKTER